MSYDEPANPAVKGTSPDCIWRLDCCNRDDLRSDRVFASRLDGIRMEDGLSALMTTTMIGRPSPVVLPLVSFPTMLLRSRV